MASRGINKVILIGNLGGDPEIRSTQGGTTVANFKLATNERRKDGDGWKDHTEWHRITCFGRLAEIVRDYASKGKQVYIEGTLRTNKWTDKEGVERFTTEVIANQLQLLGGRDGDAGERGQRGARGSGIGKRPANVYGDSDAQPPEDDDDQIPFN